MKQFDSKDDTSAFSLSALLEVIEDDEDEAIVRGSPLLADKARSVINVAVKVEGGGPTSSMCPIVSIHGKEAVAVAKATVLAYSAYVSALFDNFD